MIRLATPADVPSIIHLERACASAAHWTERQYRLSFHNESFDNQGVKRLVLVADQASRDASPAILGFLVARHLAPEWELENIVVASTARRQGLGEQLLNALLARARETKSESVFLEVRESNAAARNLYQKTGFKQTGRRKSYYKDPPEDAILFRFELT